MRRRSRAGGEPAKTIVTVAGEQPHAGAVAPRHDAETIVLDFVTRPVVVRQGKAGTAQQSRPNYGYAYATMCRLIGILARRVESAADNARDQAAVVAVPFRFPAPAAG
jgi:hypothetical protein